MSVDSVKKFLDHVEKDKALRAKVKEASDQLVRLAKEHGYSFSREELNNHMREKWGVSKPKTAASGDDPDTCFIFSEPPSF
jgi:predicted ribosomally synthesized peptide with nif11-like leader